MCIGQRGRGAGGAGQPGPAHDFDLIGRPHPDPGGLHVVTGHAGVGVGGESDEAGAVARVGLGRPEEEGEGVVVGHLEVLAVVHAADDVVRPAPVVGAAVHGEGQVDGVAPRAPHPVGVGGVEGRKGVEGVGVVATELASGADQVDELGPVGVGPQVDVEADTQDLDQPAVALEHGDVVGNGPVARQEGLVGALDQVEQLVERRPRLVLALAHVMSNPNMAMALPRTILWTTSAGRWPIIFSATSNVCGHVESVCG